MGAERWLQFKESEKAKAYLEGVKELGIDGEYGCWVTWRDLSESGQESDLEVGYSFGGASDEWAKVICRELAKRFEVARIGSDSAGWYDEPPKGKPYQKYKSWPEWIADCQPFAEGTSAGIIPEAEELRIEMNQRGLKFFKDLDDKGK